MTCIDFLKLSKDCYVWTHLQYSFSCVVQFLVSNTKSKKVKAQGEFNENKVPEKTDQIKINFT